MTDDIFQKPLGVRCRLPTSLAGTPNALEGANPSAFPIRSEGVDQGVCDETADALQPLTWPKIAHPLRHSHARRTACNPDGVSPADRCPRCGRSCCIGSTAHIVNSSASAAGAGIATSSPPIPTIATPTPTTPIDECRFTGKRAKRNRFGFPLGAFYIVACREK